MNQIRKIASLLLVAGLILGVPSSQLGATSAVPEPGAFGIPINPNAPGTKVSGPMSVAYDIREVPFETCDSGRQVLNLFVVVTLQQGNTIQPFNGAMNPASPFCFGEGTAAQVGFMFGLITGGMPTFFGSAVQPCTDAAGVPTFVRPCWAVKSITNFLSTGTGAMSLNLTLAVQ